MSTLFDPADLGAVSDPDEPAARRVIEAYFDDVRERAQAKLDEAAAALEAVRGRVATWQQSGELSRHDALFAAMFATEAAIRTAQPVIAARAAYRTPDRAQVDTYERASAEEQAVRRYLRAHGHPEVLGPEDEQAAPTGTRRKPGAR